MKSSLWKELAEFGLPMPDFWDRMKFGEEKPRLKFNPTDPIEKQVDDIMNEHERRRQFIRKYSFAFPSPEAIYRIIQFAGGEKILEIGSGSGLWARLLSDEGAQITATDSYSWETDESRSLYAIQPGKFYPVQKMMGGWALRKFADHTVLLLCWPPYDSPMAYRALSGFKGRKLAYIGEYNGCTGDRAFRKLLEKQWKRVAHHSIPKWEGLHDYLMLYERT